MLSDMIKAAEHLGWKYEEKGTAFVLSFKAEDAEFCTTPLRYGVMLDKTGENLLAEFSRDSIERHIDMWIWIETNRWIQNWSEEEKSGKYVMKEICRISDLYLRESLELGEELRRIKVIGRAA